jgi:hypothetical protein
MAEQKAAVLSGEFDEKGEERGIGHDSEGPGITERYIRVGVKPNRNGFSYESTVSVRTTDDALDIQQELSALAYQARTVGIASIEGRLRDVEAPDCDDASEVL